MQSVAQREHINFLGLTLGKVQIAAISLAFVHLCGIIGLLFTSYVSLFELATPINLILSVAVLLLFHRQWNNAFIGFMLLAFMIGYFVEVAGVHSSIIFGSYQYETSLGFKVWQVPLIIGINWFMLVYITGSMANRLSLPTWSKALFGASLMVLIDVFIEPFAIAHHLWSWAADEVPIRNYVAWFVIAYLLQLIYYRLPFKKNNSFAIYLYGIQLLFFVIVDLSHLFIKTI